MTYVRERERADKDVEREEVYKLGETCMCMLHSSETKHSL